MHYAEHENHTFIYRVKTLKYVVIALIADCNKFVNVATQLNTWFNESDRGTLYI